MPALQEASTAPLTGLLCALSTQAQKLHAQVRARTSLILPQLRSRMNDRTILCKTGFLNVPEIMQVELIRNILVELGCGERDLITEHYQRIIQLAQSNASGKYIQLPDGFVVYKQYENLIFLHQGKESCPQTQPMKATELVVPGSTQFGNYTIKTSLLEFTENIHAGFQRKSSKLTEHLDWDKLDLPIYVRFRQAGDRFCPLGKSTAQKLGKFLTKAKIPERQRDHLLVLTDAKKVIWVCPVRISDAAKITARTKQVIKIEVQSTR